MLKNRNRYDVAAVFRITWCLQFSPDSIFVFQGETLASEHCVALSQERIDMLNSIGFEWRVKKVAQGCEFILFVLFNCSVTAKS